MMASSGRVAGHGVGGSTTGSKKMDIASGVGNMNSIDTRH